MKSRKIKRLSPLKIQSGPLVYRLFLILTLTQVTSSCTRENSKEKAQTNVQIVLPKNTAPAVPTSEKSLHHSVNSQSTNTWGQGSITSSSEINCYLVTASGGSDSFNHCKDRSGSEAVRFGQYAGGAVPGQTIEFDLKSGESKTFTLFGGKAVNDACRSFKSSGPDKSNLSFFRILDSKTVDLGVGDTTVRLKQPSNLSSLKEIDECQVTDMPGANTGSPSNSINLAELFGNTRDGDVTTTANTSLTGATTHTTWSAFATISPIGTFSSHAGKKVSSSHRVSGIPSPNQMDLASAITAADFETDDEVLWVVVAANGGGSPDTACGANLSRGKWGTARVTSTTTTTLTLDRNIYDPGSAPAVNSTNLSNGSTSTAGSFCRILVVRMPNYRNFTVNHSLAFNADNFTSSMSSGGVVALRIQNLNIGGAGTLSLNSTGKGFQGVIQAQGDSVAGSGIASTSANETGGAGDNVSYGSGGGNGGAGGNSTTPLTGGSAFSSCSGPCGPYRDQKAIMGAAGGGQNAASGTSGGGLVFLFIKNLTGTGNLIVSANGTDDNTGGGYASGAGGTILVMAQSITSTGAVLVSARGGDRLTVATNGGSGGGGVAEINACNNSAPFTVDVRKGYNIGGAPQQGGDGVSWTNYSMSALCP